ncbi:MAG: hypothetical protein U5L11_12780 [Arhodomonas sp.]|nr:hypothetical protein [Arhodomonas sp.]
MARSDDMIVSSGYNISGPEVENALLEHPAVAECAVVGVPDEERGQLVKAFVVPAESASPGEQLAGELQAQGQRPRREYRSPGGGLRGRPSTLPRASCNVSACAIRPETATTKSH